MNPASIDAMSWEMAEVYGAITDQIVINLAHYFPYLTAGKHPPKSMFDYQAAMLAQMGKINAQTMQIIRNNLSDADRALSASLETAIADAIKDSEPALYRGAKAGVFKPPTKPVLSANQTRAFGLYYKQAADKLNLVNTVMLESTQSAYMQTVSNVISEYEILERINRTQIALDVAAGETITGVSSWNTAVRHATQRMKDGGITGFIDHAGRHWDAETYVAMDVRTTMFNTGRAAVWETNEGFGNDLYIVSYHNGARPLCYDWQNKVISANNVSRDVADLDGNVVHVYAQNETTYGEPAGLFGINCKHYPTPFVPGVSAVRGQVQDKAENDKQYAESQKQRALERNLREQKRDLEMLKAQGADEDIIRAQREKVRAASKDIEDFCDETGRVRRRNREAVYTKRDFPSGNYDPSQFAREQQKRFDDYWKNGGTQTGRTFGTMQPVTNQSNRFYDEFGDAPQPTYRDMEYGTDEYFAAREKFRSESAEYKEKVGTWFDNNYGGKTVSDEQFSKWIEQRGIVQYGSIEGLDRRALAAYMERFDQLSADFPQVLEHRKNVGLPFEISYNPRAGWTAEASHGMSFGNGFDDYRYVAVSSADVVKTGMVHGANPALQVFDHEFGHNLFDAMQKSGLDLDDVTREIAEMRVAMRKDLVSTLNGLNGISEYATTNADELFAEAFSAWYGGETTPFANAFGEFLRRWGAIK